MINIKNIRNQKVNLSNLVEALFYSFPITFIIGNLAVTLNLLFFILASFFLIKKKQLNYRFNNSSWLLIVFFLYLLISTTIQFQPPGPLYDRVQHWSFEEHPIFKSFMLIRFPILIFLVDTLFYNKLLDLKKFFLSSFICTSFVSFDVIYQYFVGYDLFGYKSMGHRNSGPFNDEYIAGSYLVKFSFFSIFYVYEIFKNKNSKNLFLIFVITFYGTAQILAGNRMPTLLFLFGCIIIILFVKNFRFIMSLGLVALVSIFFTLSHYESKPSLRFLKITDVYSYFYGDLKRVLIGIKKNITESEHKKSEIKKEEKHDPFYHIKNYYSGYYFLSTGHGPVFLTAIEMWMEKPWTGYGLKSFRIICYEILEKDYGRVFYPKVEMTHKNKIRHCANHSHNYYLELLSETGIIGTSLMIIFFFILLKNSFYCLKQNLRKTDINLLVSILIILFIEIWPIKSSGSFFTTWNATFFWLATAMLISIYSKKDAS